MMMSLSASEYASGEMLYILSVSGRGSEDYCVPYRRHKIGQLHQLFRVQSLSALRCREADALAYDRYHRKPHRLAGDASDSVEVICDCVSRYLNRSERGYDADYKYAPEGNRLPSDAWVLS